ncbi:hypothetical protein GCK32_014864 [Trichostrongylus colubriformis]|uniref:Uncharacterized protein n=1 Tax=Trichostrongylus colubriformis TaxID=6319 RepID=A0AAN8EUY6_TRICO
MNMAGVFSNNGHYGPDFLLSLVSSLAARNAVTPPEGDQPETHSDGSDTPDDVSSVVSTPSEGVPPAKRRRKPDGKLRRLTFDLLCTSSFVVLSSASDSLLF